MTTIALEAAATAAVEFVCVTLVSLFLLFCCIPSLHGRVRQLVRPWVLFHVESGLDWCIDLQKLQNPWLTALFVKFGHTVSVPFYGIFLPALIWIGLPELGWHLIVLMAMTLYVGNAIKDLVSSPRPFAVKFRGRSRIEIIGTETKEMEMNSMEYGCPSSHTMNSLALNFYLCHYLHEHGLVSDATAAVLYVLVMAWVCIIATSRLYLGLHTPIDIIVGAVAGLTVVISFTAVEGLVNAWVQQPPHIAISLATVFCLVLLRLHPKPAEHTPSYQFSTSFMGVLFGVVVGVSRYPEFFNPPVQLHAVWSHSLLWCIRRLLTGFVLIVASKEGFKLLSVKLLPYFYAIFPLGLRKMWQPPVHSLVNARSVPQELHGLPLDEAGRPWDVIVTAKFFGYAGLGWCVCELCPRFLSAFDW